MFSKLSGRSTNTRMWRIVYAGIAVLLLCVACVSISAGMLFLSEPHVTRMGPFTSIEMGISLIILGMVSIGKILFLRETGRI